MPDKGLARARGDAPRSANILAHVGWAHWLNRHIAEKEFGPAAEQSVSPGALHSQPTNVYANAMFGNWLLSKMAEASTTLFGIFPLRWPSANSALSSDSCNSEA